MFEELTTFHGHGVALKCWAHWKVLLKWNQKINLTSITSDRQSEQLHYLDSLQGLPYIIGERVLDIGSGAGFPGIPLAIATPTINYTLLEPRRKRVSFLRTVKSRLGLSNVEIIEGRSTDEVKDRYDTVVTRATFATDDDLTNCLKWVNDCGSLVLYRAIDAETLPGAVRKRYTLNKHVRSLDIINKAIHSP
ncbi:MAG: 16S rRNA (guanine(527)-N(7))-methyltransferase RsmG [Myxococcota bacterium]|nr:16S rRNA (guanine(527)-N(7))-methyltransferase RsmG [Myxococcota bacterium]